MTWALVCREVGPRRAVGRGGGLTRAHGYPLVAALRRTDSVGWGQFSTWYRMGAERSQAEVDYEWTSK